MGILDWITGAKQQPEPERPAHPPGPFGLRLFRSADVDLLDASILSGKLTLPMPDKHTLVITGHGIVELEPGVFLHRFYDDETRFLQVVAQGRGPDATVQDVSFFRHWHGIVPSPAEWPLWTGRDGRLGAKSLTVRDVEFKRAWNAEEAGWVPAVEFSEEVFDDEGGHKFVRQGLMLYERFVSEDASEVMIASVEVPDGGRQEDATLEFYLGCPVSSAAVRPV